jgi:hypothetical protein
MPSTTTRSWSCPRARGLRPGKRDGYVQDVDIYKLASEMLVDGIIAGSELRGRSSSASGTPRAKQLEFTRVEIPFSRSEPGAVRRAVGYPHLAVRFLTIVPVPGRGDGAGALGRAAWWFPAVGLGLGACLVAADHLVAFVFPSPAGTVLPSRCGRSSPEASTSTASPTSSTVWRARCPSDGWRSCGTAASASSAPPDSSSALPDRDRALDALPVGRRLRACCCWRRPWAPGTHP